MTKSDLIESMRKETGLSESKSEQVVELLFNKMTEALAAGDRSKSGGSVASMSRNIRGIPGEIPRPENRSRYHPRNCPSSSAARS